MQAIPLVIPDEVLDFKGSATELAELCNRLLRENELDDGGDEVANERLIRHYVQMEVLTPPLRQGRDAVYGARQAAEFVIARKLLGERWPLAKIAELITTYKLPIPALAEGESELPTEAEQVIARLRATREGSAPRAGRHANVAMSPAMSMDAPDGIAGRSDSVPRAATLAARRMNLGETLRTLGNEAGEVEREEILRIRLTPWATVDIDARQLRYLGPETAETLGKALADALREERITRGDKR